MSRRTDRQTGQPYTTIMKVWSRIRAEAGVPFLRIHDLRHMYASFLVNSGRTLYEVQQILGHSTYIDHLPSDLSWRSCRSKMPPMPRRLQESPDRR